MPDYYKAAYNLGKKEVLALAAQNKSTELPVLDDLLEGVSIVGEIPLGLIDIPTELLVGTKTRGRTNAFSPSFYPLLEDSSEFAMKWSSLCTAHLEEGIREPIKAYEYMNKFYVQEGNKRVSVLKCFKADSIPGYVTRMIPAREDTHESRLYYEYLDFYNATNINYITFRKEGDYTHLSNLIGYKRYDRWSIDDRIDFRSVYSRISEAAVKINGDSKLPFLIGEAIIIYCDVFSFEQLREETPSEIETNLKKIWGEVLLATTENQDSIHLMFDPVTEEDAPKKNLLTRILSTDGSTAVTKVAFINKKTPETSAWTYGHELGRLHLDEVFQGQLETLVYNDVDDGDQASEAIEDALNAGADIVFTTSPAFMSACVKSVVAHPTAKIFNCSVNAKHKSIRTYYGRMFEAKFLTGVLAGIMTDTNKIGYIADYPIYGMTANINAFAVGVKMVNPRAKIYLEWSTAKENQGVDLTQKFMDMGVTYISAQDWITPQNASRKFGLYRINGETPANLATPVWNWGKYYEQIIRNIQHGTWNVEEKHGTERSVSYWWGMSSDVIDVIFSNAIPSETISLLEVLREGMRHYVINPFNGLMHDQNGNRVKLEQFNGNASPGQIIHMDWLLDNILGYLPTAKDLVDEAYTLVLHAGVKKEEGDDL